MLFTIICILKKKINLPNTWHREVFLNSSVSPYRLVALTSWNESKVKPLKIKISKHVQ